MRIKFYIHIILLIFSFNVTSAWGQMDEPYIGQIVDSDDNSMLEGVICRTLDEHGESINYCISDIKGNFSLKRDDKARLILFNLLGYEMKKMAVEEIDNPKNVIISMNRTDFNLQEVKVTVPPIQNNNDTIRYNVGSFKGQEDKYIADILKKLPGVKVAENGTISYQGEAINKFYIEGRDVLGGQYNIATNNLNVDAVSFVEVLENNQHIKALKGEKFSEKAAINLRLKKDYTMRPLGEAQLGFGGYPLLYNEKIFAAYLGNKMQAIANFKVNNTGESVLDELEDKLDMSDLFSYEPLTKNLINPPSSQNIPLTAKRYLFNESYLGSINNLIPLSTYSELKVNLSYGMDKLTQNYYLEQNYSIGNDILRIEEQSELKSKLSNSRFSIIYENNNPNSFIKNDVAYYNRNQKVTSGIQSSKDLSIYNTNNPFYIQNDFQGLVKFGNNKSLNVNSLFRYSNNDECLKMFQTAKYANSLEELFYGRYFINKNQITSSYSLFGNKLDIGLGLIYRKRTLENNLTRHLETIDTLTLLVPFQKNETEQMQFLLSPSYQIKKGKKFVFTINLPISYYRYGVRNAPDLSLSDHQFTIMPAFSCNYNINHYWEVFSKVGYDFRYADDNSLLSSPFFRNYRTIYVPFNTLNNSDNYTASARLRYKDIIDMLFFNFYVLFRNSRYNYISKFYNTDEWSYATTDSQNSSSSMFMINSDISKNFIPIKLALTINPSFTQMRSQLIQQDFMIYNTSNVASLLAKAELKAINKTSIIYSTVGRAVWNDNNMTNTTLLKDFMQNLALYFFPNKNIDLSLASEYVLFEKKKDVYSSFFFLDITGRYKYKKLEFSVVGNNLLDNDIYSKMQLSTVNSFYQELPLRGREVIFFVKFAF